MLYALTFFFGFICGAGMIFTIAFVSLASEGGE